MIPSVRGDRIMSITPSKTGNMKEYDFFALYMHGNCSLEYFRSEIFNKLRIYSKVLKISMVIKMCQMSQFAKFFVKKNNFKCIAFIQKRKKSLIDSVKLLAHFVSLRNL